MSISRRKPRVTPHQNQEQNQGWKSVVIPTVITATAVILASFIPALFDFPPFIELFQKSPTPTVVFTITNTLIPISQPTATESIPPTPSFTNMPSATATQTYTPTFTNMPTATYTYTPTTTATKGLPVGMDVQLAADITSGKSPLKVNFDARGSFFRDSKGDIYPCGVCNYTWYVYQNSKLVNEPERGNNGTFGYRFGKGAYRVVVRVCRGQGDSDCAFDAEEISVR